MLHGTKNFCDDGVNEGDGNGCLVAQTQDRIKGWDEQGTATHASQTDEKAKNKSEYFGLGSIEVSEFDNWCAWSLDLKGSEFFDIYLKNLSTGEIIEQKINNTSGSITWDLEEKSFFYSRLDKFHRPKQIFKHILGTSTENDQLIFEEKDETFTCGISITSDEKYFIIGTSDHITTEEYFFPTDARDIKPTLFQKRKKKPRKRT